MPLPVFDRFDTAVVPFPFAEVPILKRRPVAVLSAAAFNADHGATLCAMITTAKATAWPSDIALSDLAEAGLDTPCILRFRLITIPNDLFVRGLGRLAPVDRLRTEGQLARMLLG